MPWQKPRLAFAIHEFIQGLLTHQQLLLRLFLGDRKPCRAPGHFQILMGNLQDSNGFPP